MVIMVDKSQMPWIPTGHSDGPSVACRQILEIVVERVP